MPNLIKSAARIKFPRIKKALVPPFLFDYLCRCGGESPGERTEEGFLWELDRHGHWPWEILFCRIKVGDLNDDGGYEYLLSRGTIEQIAFDFQGRILWEYRDRNGLMADIRPDSEFPIYDINGDGRSELICARNVENKLSLCVVDGKTGTIVKAVPYPRRELTPHDLRGAIEIADLRGLGRPQDIVVSWDYNYVAAFDQGLNLLWEREMSTPDREANSKLGYGHGVICEDLDGDGCDELVCGATLLDQDGKVLWSRTDLPNVEGDHVDNVVVADVNEDGQKEIFLSTGGYLLDTNGNVIWTLSDRIYHGQSACIGKLRRDVPGLQIVVYDENMARLVNKRREPAVYILDQAGKILSTLGSIGIQRPYLADWDGDGVLELVMVEKGEVGIYDGTGNKLAAMPLPIGDPRIESSTQFGFVGDICGDLRDEVILVSLAREETWFEVYTCGDKNSNETTRRVPKARCNSKYTANWSPYH